MSDYQLLVFDWDGTLCDSIGIIVEAVHSAADRCAMPRRSDEQVKGIIGLELSAAIRALYPELDQASQVDFFRRCYSEAYVDMDQVVSPLFAGVRESLEVFRAQGYRLAVATGKTRRGLDRVLRQHGMQDFFDVTRSAGEAASKPDPQMLNEILVHCGVPARQSLMVGDSTFDLLMAQNAGVDCVAVSYGAQAVSVLRDCSPRLVVDRFEQLRDWLDQGAHQVAVAGAGHYVG